MTIRIERILIEGRDEIRRPPPALVESLVATLGAPGGPTYLILTGPGEQYVQAAGSDGRFALESRDTYGEGFQHLRAGMLTGRKTTIGYRRRCPQGIHPPRGCPHEIDAGCVLGLRTVREALLHYALTGERHPRLDWHNVTPEYLDKLPRDDPD